MSDAFVRLAPYLKDPLILSGFFVFISFGFWNVPNGTEQELKKLESDSCK